MQKREDLTRVLVYDNDIDRAIRLLGRKVANAETFKVLKCRAFNPSPADRRRQKRLEAKRRIRSKSKKQMKGNNNAW
jgi:small subunit ribosomal protein S21